MEYDITSQNGRHMLFIKFIIYILFFFYTKLLLFAIEMTKT